MSFPNIPNVTPEIKLKRKDVINLLLASIAMEEIGLSHIINAEGEKIQFAISKHTTIAELLRLNRSVEKTLRNVIMKQMLLQFKLEDVLMFEREEICEEEMFEEEKDLSDLLDDDP